MEDTYILIESYNTDTNKLIASVNSNPFVIPSSYLHSPHTLNTIAHKVNQEDYYLSSVNRLKNVDVPHIFLMYNNLDEVFSKATAHYRTEFPLLITDKDIYKKALDELMDAARQYRIALNVRARNPSEDIILTKLNTAIPLVPPLLNSLAEQDKWLKDSRWVFIEQMKEIVPENVNRVLAMQIQEAIYSHDMYVSRMNNVVDLRHQSMDSMNGLLDAIKRIAAPMTNYIKGLKN
ncbi:hypothetical protein GCM10027423_62560 [Spirosoma arcticum]